MRLPTQRCFLVFVLQLTDSALFLPRRFVMPCASVPYCSALYHIVPCRFVPLCAFFRIASFFQVFVSCLPRLFSTYALLFPDGPYRAASFLSVSPDPALFRVALYLVPHCSIPSFSVASCSVFSRSVSSSPHFSALRFAFFCVQFRILPRLVPHRIVSFCSVFSLFLSFSVLLSFCPRLRPAFLFRKSRKRGGFCFF